MQDPTYPVPEKPAYDTAIRALQNTDPASAENVFNPLIQKLIDNTHYVKLKTDENATSISEVANDMNNPDLIKLNDGKTLAAKMQTVETGLSATESSLSTLSTQVTAIVGMDIAGSVNTAASLPDPSALDVGTLYSVSKDENHGGKSTVYEVVNSGGVKSWSFSGELGINLDDYIKAEKIGAANGVAGLDSGAKIPGTQLPNPPVMGNGYGTCATASATAAKVGTLSAFTLKTGSRVTIKFTNKDTSTNPTLNVNGTGAKPIYYNNARVSTGMIEANYLATFVYDGTNWCLMNPATGAVGSAGGFLLDITFDSALSGKSFSVSGAGFSFTGTVGSTLKTQITVPNPNTAYTITCDGNSKTVTTTQYFGYYPIKVNAVSPTFASNTWAQIAAIAESGQASSYWKVGDEKDITLTTGETLTLKIYGFKHDDLSTGGKAGITLGLKNLMASTRQMNTSNTNVGGFTGSAMYTWLQGDLYNSLPADLRAVIKTVNKKTSAGNQSSTINTNAMKIFLFSEVECFGTTTYSVAGEGSQYPVFTDNTSRIKYLSNGGGSAFTWWERSPYASGTTSFCVVASGGNAGNTGASFSWGVCFGFCI